MYLNGAIDDLHQKIVQKLKCFFSIHSIRLSTVVPLSREKGPMGGIPYIRLKQGGLVPRPLPTREKGPGIHCMRMRQLDHKKKQIPS